MLITLGNRNRMWQATAAASVTMQQQQLPTPPPSSRHTTPAGLKTTTPPSAMIQNVLKSSKLEEVGTKLQLPKTIFAKSAGDSCAWRHHSRVGESSDFKDHHISVVVDYNIFAAAAKRDLVAVTLTVRLCFPAWTRSWRGVARRDVTQLQFEVLAKPARHRTTTLLTNRIDWHQPRRPRPAVDADNV